MGVLAWPFQSILICLGLNFRLIKRGYEWGNLPGTFPTFPHRPRVQFVRLTPLSQVQLTLNHPAH